MYTLHITSKLTGETTRELHTQETAISRCRELEATGHLVFAKNDRGFPCNL